MPFGESSPSIQKFFSLINKLSRKLEEFIKKTDSYTGHVPELIAVLLYGVLHIVISIFHEPWFDEAVAWNIARCASVKEILFTIPHYEGHPPLWYLILLPFARLGCPYETALTIVSLIFSVLAVIILLYKAPFPRLIRLLLPFTYFLFYQYGVISRPYSIMMIAFFLAAASFKNKDENPWGFVLSLMLLCLSSAYGIIIAGGITIAWLIELFKKEKFHFLTNKKRTAALLCLLALALFLIALILPAEDTFATSTKNMAPDTNNIFVRLLYTLLILPADTCITNTFQRNIRLQFVPFETAALISSLFIGLIIWISVLGIAKKKGTLLFLLIPYCIYAIFTAVVYMYLHHIGVALLIFIFWAWISCENDIAIEFDLSGQLKEILPSLFRMFAAACMVISLYNGIAASVLEIIYPYSSGKNEVKFILDNGLDNYNIMVGHAVYYEYDEEGEVTGNVLGFNFNQCSGADNVTAYLDRNIFFNFNDGADDMTYTTHKVADENDCAELIQKWRAQGIPDVLYNPQEYIIKLDTEPDFGSYPEANIDSIYYGMTDISDYTLIYYEKSYQIWKYHYTEYTTPIYVRNELAKELGFEEVIAE